MNPTEPITPLEILFALLFLVFLVALYIGSLRWVYRDAIVRGKSGGWVVFLVAFTNWPLSLIAWMVFRPEKRRDSNIDSLLQR